MIDAPCRASDITRHALHERRVLLTCEPFGLKPGRKNRRRHPPADQEKASHLATHKELSDFLAEVERRAYKQALFAIRDDHLALDIVQDAMLKLSEKYSDRPPA